MDKKKILIVSRSFYPMNSPRSFRTTELVKEFSRCGHEVTLLTVKDKSFHDPFAKKHGVKIKDLGQRTLRAFDISKGGRTIRLFKRGVNRLLNLFFEFPDIELMWMVKRALKQESGYDLLISIAVPHPVHWGVAAARSPEHPIANTWAADCGDPYMGDTMDSFRKMFYFKYVEKWFCQKADFITVPIEEAKEAYYPEFRDKMRVIPQGFNFNEIDIDQTEYRPNEVPTFAYAGGLIPGGRDPGEFLEYLLNTGRDFRFILYTKDRHLVQPFLDRENGKIEVRDYIPRKELLKKLSKMDFLVNFENSTEKQLPSKLIDYYLTGRPILSVSNTDINEKVVDQFLDGDYRNRFKFNGVDRYRIENVCDRFLEL